MIFGRLDALNLFSNCGIFNLQWVYQDVTPSKTEQHLYMKNNVVKYATP
jgi:hypothetical protein